MQLESAELLQFEIRRVMEVAAAFSDDPDTKTACVAVSRDGRILCVASNRLPDRVKREPWKMERPAKYDYIVHAERNMIATAAALGEPLQGSTMYLNWFPCADCAQMIIQAGIRRVVCDNVKYLERQGDPRYGFKLAMELLTEACVQVDWL